MKKLKLILRREDPKIFIFLIFFLKTKNFYLG